MEAEKLYEEIGDRIKKLRKQKGLTQETLAALVDLERTSITNIEKGRQKMLVHTLFDIADALRTDPCLLVPKIEDQDSEAQLELNLLSKIPSTLSDDEQKWIKSVISEPINKD